MRKRTVNFLFDKLIWSVLAFLPVIAYLFYMLTFEKSAQGVTFNPNFDTFIKTSFGGNMGDHTIWYSLAYSMEKFLYELGIAIPELNPLFFSMTWLILVELFHIIVDTLLFLPRLIKKILVKCGEEE